MSLVHDTLPVGPLGNNAYVLACPETGEAAVVDPGFEPDTIVAAVRRAKLTVTRILLTHGHYDHVAAVRDVQAALGGECWMHAADRAMMDTFNAQGALLGFPPARLPDVVHDLAEGPITIGHQSLSVIHTPGHSPGHVTFVGEGDIWSGDVLFAGSVGRTDLAGGDWARLERSIRLRLFPLGDDTRVHPGHGPATTIGRERRTNPYLQDVGRPRQQTRGL